MSYFLIYQSYFHIAQPIMNKIFYFNNIKGTRQDQKLHIQHLCIYKCDAFYLFNKIKRVIKPTSM